MTKTPALENSLLRFDWLAFVRIAAGKGLRHTKGGLIGGWDDEKMRLRFTN